MHLRCCCCGAEEKKRYSLHRRLQVGDKWAQKTVPALARLSVSSVILAVITAGACVGVGRGAIRSTTIQFGWRRHGALLKWEKAVGGLAATARLAARQLFRRCATTTSNLKLASPSCPPYTY